MRSRKGTNFALIGLSCLALGLFGYIYFTSPSMPSPARIVSVKVVGNGGLYTRSYMSLVGLQFRLSIAIFDGVSD